MHSGTKEFRSTVINAQVPYQEGSKNFCYKHKQLYKLYDRTGDGTPLCKDCYSELREKAKKKAKKTPVEFDVDVLENIGAEHYQSLVNNKS